MRIEAFARSGVVQTGGLPEIHAEARRLIAGTDQAIVLRDSTDRQVLNTKVDFGDSLPAISRPAGTVTTWSGEEFFVSNVYQDPNFAEPRIEVERKFSLRNGLQHSLAISTTTTSLYRILLPTVPTGWVVGVGDRAGVYITRSERHEEVTGKPGVAEYLAKATGQSGTFTARNQFGDELLAGYFRSPVSGWLFAANIELSAVAAPLWKTLVGIIGIGASALGMSLFAAYLVGRVITREAHILAEQALDLGARRPVKEFNSRLTEFERISEALVDADAMIRERTAELEAVLETVPVAVWFTYDKTGRQVIRNRYAVELMELSPEHSKPFGAPDEVIETIAIKDGKLIARDDRPLTKAMRGETTNEEEFLYRLPAGKEITLLSSARPIFDLKGGIIGAVQVSIDITERKRIENQRRLLTKELDHRVKNNLAIVQALVLQTLRGSENLAAAQADIVARLAALANAHDILTGNAWLKGDLRTTLESTILTQAHRSRFTLSGPQVSLAPNQVMAISLGAHELTTNAIKYGALSNDLGHVAVSWKITGAPNDRWLVIEWIEHGGPAVRRPDKRGFGSRLMERMTASEGGRVIWRFEAQGLVCILEFPLQDGAA